MQVGFKKIIVLLITITSLIGCLFVFQNLEAQVSIGMAAIGSSGLVNADLTLVVAGIIQIFLGLLGLIALGLVLYGGFIWMTAAGSPEKIDKAKKILVNAVIGLIIILSAFAITSFLIFNLGNATNPPVGTPQCRDSADNDGDLLIDYPADPGCVSTEDNDEWNPGQPPTQNFIVIGTYPQMNQEDISVCVSLQATFNRLINPNTVSPGGIDNFTLKECTNGFISGCTPSALPIDGLATSTGQFLTFNPDDDLPINSAFEARIIGGTGGIRSVEGYTLTGNAPGGLVDYVWYFATGEEDDNTPPQVVVNSNSPYPADGAINICLNTTMQVEFNEPMLVSSIANSQSMELYHHDLPTGPESLYSGNFGYTNNSGYTIFNFIPQQLLDNENYRPLLQSDVITDVCENHLDGNANTIFEPGGADDYAPPEIGEPPDWSFDTGTTPECTPLITNITPDNGYYDGNFVTINGSNFINNTPGNGDVIFSNNLPVYDDLYCFNTSLSFPQIPEAMCLVDWTATQIKMKVPAEAGDSNGAITGAVRVETPSQGGNQVSNSINFNVKSPHISSLSPASGGEGQFVTLYGTNFGTTEGEVRFFNNTNNIEAVLPCEDTGWNPTYIIIAVPDGLDPQADWQIQIKTNDNHWSNIESFDVTNNPAGPGLCLLDPDSGQFEDQFNIEGVDFGASQGTSKVLFGTDIEAPVISWSDELVRASVPNVMPGAVTVSIKIGDEWSNSLPFTVESTPTTGFYISYISPTSGPENQYVTVYGNGFGPTKGPNDTVLFNDTAGNFNFPVECSTNYWSNTQIIVKVPGGLPPGPDNVQVRVKKGDEQTDPIDFTFEDTGTPTPGICSISPTNGDIDTDVTLAGEPFATVSAVNFSTITVNPPFVGQGPNTLTFNVPDNALAGGNEVKVTGPGGTSNPVNFEVTSEPFAPAENFGFYEWQFTTCDNCLIPAVVNLPCANYNGTFLSSPSPLPNTQDNFTDINLKVKFNTNMDDTSFNWASNGTVRLMDCGTDLGGGDIDCLYAGINLDIGQGQNGFSFFTEDGGEWVTMYLASNLQNGRWYQVILTGGLVSEEGWALGYNGQGGTNYESWIFKTQATGQECVADQVSVFGPSVAIVDDYLDYEASPVNSYSCNFCDANNYSWVWDTSDPTKAVISSSNLNECTAHALAVTGATPVQIQSDATPLVQGPTISGSKNLTINAGESCDAQLTWPGCQIDPTACDLGYECNNQTCLCQLLDYPIVIGYEPDCEEACPNTLIYARFNLPMDESTLNYQNIDVLPCRQDDCIDFYPEINFSLNYDSALKQINIIPTSPSLLTVDQRYRVILKDDIKASPENGGQNLGGANGVGLNYPTNSPDSFSWTFGVGSLGQGNLCDLDSVSVSPASHLFTSIAPAPNSTADYTGYAYTLTGANCGAPLNPATIDNWSWSKEDPNTPDIINVNQSSPVWTAITTAINEGGDSAYVRATAREGSTTKTNTGDNGEVLVNLTGPQVLQGCYDGYLSPAPTISGNPQNVDENVCINAAVSARFNQTMNNSTFNNIDFVQCNSGETFDPGQCEGEITNYSLNYLEDNEGNINGFVLVPPLLVPNFWYLVLIPTTVTNANNIPLEQPYQWHFKTKNNSEPCEPQIVTISPVGPTVITLTGPGSQDYTSSAQTGECGYILSDDRDWTWSSNASIASVFPESNVQVPQGQTTATAVGLGETDIQSTTAGITGSSHLIVSDSPEVISTVPPDGGTNICRNTEISATFDQPMNIQTINNNNFIVENKILIPDLQAQQWSCTYASGGPVNPTVCPVGPGGSYNNLFQRPIAVIKNNSNKVLEKIFLALSNLKNNFFEKATADTPPLPDDPPPPVTGFTANAITSVQINLSWNDVTLESGYKIWRSTTQNVFPATPLVILPDNTTAYSDTTVDPCTDYYYRIVAYNGVGESPFVDTAESTPNAANNYYWCAVNGNFNYTNNNNQTTAYFSPAYLLPANATVRIKILGGVNGVKNIYDLPMQQDYLWGQPNYPWNFVTGGNICEINFVKVYSNYISESNNSSSWLFNTNVDNPLDNSATSTELFDGDKFFTAKAYSVSGQPLTETSEYNWEWSWESDNTIVANVTDTDNFQQLVTAEGQNGLAQILATASTTPTISPIYESTKKTGSATAEVDLCENPWIDPLTTQTPVPGGNYIYTNSYFQDNAYNFKLKYCRDAGAQGAEDDLPILDQTPLFSTPNVSLPSGDEFLKEYIFWIYDYPPPTDLEATLGARVGSQQTVGLSWTEVTAPNLDLEYYEFQRATTGTFQNFTTFTCNSSPCNNTFTLPGSTYLTTVYYYFRVKAVYLTGPSATSSSAWSNIVNVGVNIGPGTGT